MRKLLTGVALVAVVAGMTVLAPQPAQARKEYMDAFLAKYDKLSDEDKEKKCAICHSAASKKDRSDYAQALEKALGAKMVKEADKIDAALVEVEGKEYEDGKTYGELLEAGTLPAPFVAAEEGDGDAE
jgi:hypothetical protein